MPDIDPYPRGDRASRELDNQNSWRDQMGGGPASTSPLLQSPLEQKLIAAGITQKDLADTVRAINWTVEQTGLKAHPAEQEKGVKLCMGAAGDVNQVREITNMVVEGMLKKGQGIGMQAKTGGGISMGQPKQNQLKL